MDEDRAPFRMFIAVGVLTFLLHVYQTGKCLHSQHKVSGHPRPASRTPLKCVSLAGRWWPRYKMSTGQEYFWLTLLGAVSILNVVTE